MLGTTAVTSIAVAREKELLEMNATTEEHLPDDAQGTRQGVVVGVDGSPHADRALRLGAALASARGVPLTAVFAYTMSPYAINAASYGQPVVDEKALKHEGEEILRRALSTADAARGDVRTAVERGPAGQALAHHSRNADVIVVGTRGRGGFTGMLLGSTSASLPSRSHCPVVIVPHSTDAGDAEPDPQAPVSVGVDGSAHSLVAALEAAAWAESLGVPLRLLSALPPMAADVMTWAPLEAQVQEARDQLTGQLEEDATWLRGRCPEVDVSISVVDGAAATVMVEASKTSQLTVVGTRGHGGFVGMLVGSTSSSTMHHAQGPLMIVSQEGGADVGDHRRMHKR
ncbi:universal stress protein [Nesterenkonia xinjiangensis]|uniref:Nucleotide-binding universal stress UspA family protein n=1 Tax=Nesterenkonia xinjiangensis TaxID=225327 RepID=A0A7Z0GMF2_9MICC|nr:universal stress protein [Nesterenkonia xinjiangensis]NYJ78675.1 nucleotide-binding universal stress UspA family protein [Nesterenkonia xinjiangensis]